MEDDFEATSSWCYRFARYTAIPQILAHSDVRSGQSVRLIDISRQVLDEHLTREQQDMRYDRAQADGQITVAASVKFYIPFIAKQTGQLVNLGGGMFRLPTEEDINEEEIEAEAVDSGVVDGVDDADEFSGWIYAFSFPSIQQFDGPYPIKVGKTTGDVVTRVNNQCRQSAIFENPIILGRWQVERVSPTELAVHYVLKARGRWRENAPGNEWFDTTVSEVSEIINLIKG